MSAIRLTARQVSALKVKSAVRATIAPTRGGKYGAIKTTVEGIQFDSKREAARYSELVLLQRAGKISGLETKTPACVFQLVVNGHKIGR